MALDSEIYFSELIWTDSLEIFMEMDTIPIQKINFFQFRIEQ